MAGERMLREMGQQPEVLAALAARRGGLAEAVRAVRPRRPAGVALVARGSSDHAAVFGRYVLEVAVGRPVALTAPSLTTVYDARVDYTDYLAVAVSQSGHTPEIVTVVDRMRAAGARTVAITNDADTPLGRAADVTLAFDAGVEEAVPATKTYTAEVACFAVLAEALGPVPWSDDAWDRLPDAVSGVLDDPGPGDEAATRIGEASGLIAVARGYLYGLALEAALKLKETTGILAEGYSAADLRHGPIATAQSGVPILAFLAPGAAAADMRQLVDRLRAGGSPVLTVGPGETDLPVPDGLAEPLVTIPSAVRAQQVARSLALARGLDPDAPPGLTKVTPTT